MKMKRGNARSDEQPDEAPDETKKKEPALRRYLNE
jgi:hypothetical protein